MALIDIDSLDLSDTMKHALRECVMDPEKQISVSKRTAKALEKRKLVQRSDGWIWVSPETAALYTDGPVIEPEPVIEQVIEPEPEPVIEPEPEPEPVDPFTSPEPAPRIVCVRGSSQVGRVSARVGLQTSQGEIAAWSPSEVRMVNGSVHAAADLLIRVTTNRLPTG